MKLDFAKDPNRYKRKTHGELIPRVCQYKECKDHFIGLRSQKYCYEHRKPEYKSKKYYYKTEPENSNMIYEHSLNRAARISFNCECCGTPYEILVLPKIKVYPKYCVEHRNEHKRNLFKGALK